MKICIAISSIDKNSGGPSRSVPMLAKGLSSLGVDTTLMVQESKNMNYHLLNHTGVKLVVLPRKSNNYEIKRIIQNERFDLIHSQNLWTLFYNKVARIARECEIPYIMTPRGTLEPWSLSQKRLKKIIALSIYQKNDLRKANCILATSKMEAANVRRLGIKTPIAVIPNGIDVSEYKCRSIDFLPKVKKQILFLSRIHPKKGIEVLIRSWASIEKLYPDWNVVIAGNGDEAYIHSLRELINSYMLLERVKIIPPVFGKKKKELYCESSLFVLPTYSENFGMVIAEAMSCGVPVVTTNGTPWQELNELNIGWCIDLSVENLSKVLKEAMDLGPEKLFNKGLQCSKHIHDNYQYSEVAKKNLATYEWILNSKQKPLFVQ